MIIVDQVKQQLKIMLHTVQNVESMSIGSALKYYYLISIIPLILSVLLNLSAILYTVVLFWIGIPILAFVISAVMHLLGKNISKYFKGGYRDSFTSTIYAISTVMLFYWLNTISIFNGIGWFLVVLFGIWGFIVQVFGLSKLQNISGFGSFIITIITYIIIAVIASILFFLFVSNISSLLSLYSTGNGSCSEYSNIICQNVTYSSATGNVSVTIGQNENITWTSVKVAFVANASDTIPPGTPEIPIPGGLKSGATVSLELPATGQVKIGTPISGSIDVNYTTSNNPTPRTYNIGYISNVKAT